MYKEIDNTYEGSDARSVQSLIEGDRYIDRCIDSQDRGCNIVIANKEKEKHKESRRARETFVSCLSEGLPKAQECDAIVLFGCHW